MKSIHYLLIAITLFTGCTTIKVVKVEPGGNQQGVRYTLAKPYIQVTPNPSGDGAYKVEVVYLPDPDQTYAVQTSTFLAKNSMEVKVDESGILSKIDWSGASDALPSQAATSLGNIAKAEIDRRKAENDKEEEEAKKKKEEADKNVTTLQDNLAQKKLDLKIARADLRSLENTYRGSERTAEIKEKMRQLRLSITRLEDEITALETKLNEAEATAQQLGNAFNEPAAGKEEEAWGPVLFSIVPTKDENGQITNISIKAVSWPDGKKQTTFKTADKVEPDKKPTASPKLNISGEITESYGQTGLVTINLSFSDKIDGIDKTQSMLISIGGMSNPDFSKVSVATVDDKNVRLTFKKADIPPGKYSMDLHFKYKDGDASKTTNGVLDITLTN